MAPPSILSGKVGGPDLLADFLRTGEGGPNATWGRLLLDDSSADNLERACRYTAGSHKPGLAGSIPAPATIFDPG